MTNPLTDAMEARIVEQFAHAVERVSDARRALPDHQDFAALDVALGDLYGCAARVNEALRTAAREAAAAENEACAELNCPDDHPCAIECQRAVHKGYPKCLDVNQCDYEEKP